MQANQTLTKLKKAGARVASSTALLMIVFFFACEAAIKEIRPLRFFNHTGLTTINQNFLVSKLPPCLSSPENADVLLLGSSLVLVPSVRCDDDFHGRKTRYDRWYYRNVIDEYKKADFFQDKLSTACHRNLKVADLAVAASMMSDQYLILKKYLDSGKNPSLIVCGIAPRDCLDNLRPDPEKTPTYSILADLTCLKDLFDQKRSKEAIANFAFGYVCDVYKNRLDYKTFISGLTARTTGHPVDLYQATHVAAAPGETEKPNNNSTNEDPGVLNGSKPIYSLGPNKLTDLKEYHRIYLPVNEGVFNTQMNYLDKFLALAHKNNIPVVLVEMPVTRENLAILPDEIKERFQRRVDKLAVKYQAKVVIPKDMPFEKEDFEDSVHLNGKGGKKLFAFVAKEIGVDKALASRSFDNNQRVGALPFKWPL